MSTRKVILKINHSNWGEIYQGHWWKDTYWTIYEDGTVRAKVEYSVYDEQNKKIEKKITPEELKKVLNYIEHIKKEDEEIMALDGTAWAIKQYDGDKLIYERKPGHIYGIKSFETLGYILYKMMDLDPIR